MSLEGMTRQEQVAKYKEYRNREFRRFYLGDKAAALSEEEANEYRLLEEELTNIGNSIVTETDENRVAAEPGDRVVLETNTPPARGDWQPTIITWEDSKEVPHSFLDDPQSKGLNDDSVFFDIMYPLHKSGVNIDLAIKLSAILVKMDPSVLEKLFNEKKVLGDFQSLLIFDPDTIGAIYGISREEAAELIASGIFEMNMDSKWKEELLSNIGEIRERFIVTSTAK